MKLPEKERRKNLNKIGLVMFMIGLALICIVDLKESLHLFENNYQMYVMYATGIFMYSAGMIIYVFVSPDYKFKLKMIEHEKVK